MSNAALRITSVPARVDGVDRPLPEYLSRWIPGGGVPIPCMHLAAVATATVQWWCQVRCVVVSRVLCGGVKCVVWRCQVCCVVVSIVSCGGVKCVVWWHRCAE
jgi:hypothetical protein